MKKAKAKTAKVTRNRPRKAAHKAARKPRPKGKASKSREKSDDGTALRAVRNTEHPKGFAPRPSYTRWPAEITIGKRHRKEFGDLAALARSFNERGALIQPIAIRDDGHLVAGERRLKAWQHPTCQFKDLPIPVHVITIDAIVAGEWDENAQRKDFTPEEAVSIKKEIEQLLKTHAKDRQRAHGGTAPGRKGESKGEAFRANERAAQLTGMKRRTLEKAEKVVDAAAREPEKYGKLRDDMNRTGKVDGPFKRMLVMQQTEALRKAPPPLPMRGPYHAVVVDYPWPAEKDADQADIDARGRAMRAYPEMSIAEGCKLFRSKDFQALLAPDVRVYFWTTNHHMDQAFVLLKAMGFGTHSTIGTWRKDKLGRGHVLRGKTEHCILASRGKPVTNINDAAGGALTTDWSGEGWAVREDSRKPDAFYDLVEQHTPAPRYAEIFSRGGRNEKWDCHGDQAGKFAPSVAKEAQDAILKETRHTPDEMKLAVLEAIEMGETPDLRLVDKAVLDKLERYVTGVKKLKLTKTGEFILGQLRSEAADRKAFAELPSGDDLVTAYCEVAAELDRAIVARDRDVALATAKRLDQMVRKAEGGDIGFWVYDVKASQPCGKLLTAAAAPLGAIPAWGCNGLFAADVDEIPQLIHVMQYGDFEGFQVDVKSFAVDPDKPFVDACGREVYTCIDIDTNWDEIAGRTFRDVVIDMIKAKQRDAARDGKGKRAKPVALPNPSHVYALPKTWDGLVEPEHLTVKKARALLKAEEKAPDRGLPVRRTLPGRDAQLIAFAETCGHVVTRTIDHGTNESVATCECGWSHRIVRVDGNDKKSVTARQAQGRVLDETVTAHWREAQQASPVDAAALVDWNCLTAVQAGRPFDDSEIAAREGRGLLKRKRAGKGFVLTADGEKRLAALDALIATCRAIPLADAHRVLNGQVFNEFPAAPAAGDGRPTADEPAAAARGGRDESGAASVSPADPLDIPDYLRRTDDAPATEPERATSLVNPRLLPSAKEVAAIADRAEAGRK